MEIYKTSDIQIAAVLLTAGFRVVERTTAPASRGSTRPRIVFHFEEEDGLRATVLDYTNDALQMNPRELFSRLRELKALVHQGS